MDLLDEIRKRHNLEDYHLNYLLDGERRCGFSGTKVLEVGGSLPKELVIDYLKVSQWLAITDFSYWDESTSTVENYEYRPVTEKVRSIKELTEWPVDKNYEVFEGKVENLSESHANYFDRIFSVACFEHMNIFGYALEKMHMALKPGGVLFSIFAPVWSSHNGHHLPTITDKKGNKFNFGSSPIPPWGHLLLTPPQMYEHLKRHTDSKAAGEINYHIYHGSHINRLFSEDYLEFVKNSPFKIKEFLLTFSTGVPEDILEKLKILYPRNKYFDNSGILVVLEK